MTSRADLVVNLTFAATLFAPWVVWLGSRLARRGAHHLHRRVQVAALVVCWLTVLALELRIRLAGGSGSFVDGAGEALRPWARGLLLVHVAGAVGTYAVWTWLAVVSWRRFGRALPGAFSRRHRRVGTGVLGGLCFTALSAAGMYLLVFVL